MIKYCFIKVILSYFTENQVYIKNAIDTYENYSYTKNKNVKIITYYVFL